MPEDTDPRGRAIYADYIKEQQEAQEARKLSLEQRGLAVITPRGARDAALRTTALSVRRASTFVIPDSAAVLLVVALVFFVLAALLAIGTNLPVRRGVSVDALRKAVQERWEDSEAVASEMVALTRLKTLASAKRNNDLEGRGARRRDGVRRSSPWRSSGPRWASSSGTEPRGRAFGKLRGERRCASTAPATYGSRRSPAPNRVPATCSSRSRSRSPTGPTPRRSAAATRSC